MTGRTVSECMRQTAVALPKVEELFEGIIYVHVYEGLAQIHAWGVRDRELRKSAAMRPLKEYDEYSLDIDGVHVFWLEEKEGDDEAV